MALQFFDSPNVQGIAAPGQMGALSKLGLILQNIADPTTLPKYQEALQQQQIQQLRVDEYNRQTQRESALSALAASPQFNSLDTAGKFSALAAIDPSYADDLLNYQASQEITPYQQAQLGIDRERIAAANSEAATKREAAQREQDLIMGALGMSGQTSTTTGSPDPDALAQIGVITGNSGLISYASSLKEQQAAQEAQQRAREGQISKANSSLSALGDARELAGSNILGVPTSTGIVGQLLRNVGGTNALDLDKAVDTIKANLSFDALQEMRNNSPTGGALGSIAVRELDLLGSTVASLDTAQGQDAVIKGIKKIEDHYNKYLNAIGATPNNPVFPSTQNTPDGTMINWDSSSTPSGGWSARRIR